jgi:hypothetical protein
VGGIDAGGAGSSGGVAGLAAVGTLLAGGAVDEVSVGAGAGGSDGVEDGSSGASGALGGVERVAGRAVEGRAGVALEGLGGIEVVAGQAGAGAVVGIVPKTSLGVAGNAGGRSNGGVETSVGGAWRDTAASAGVVCLGVLRDNDIGEQVLINSLASYVRNSDDDISNCGVDVDSLEDLVDTIEDITKTISVDMLSSGVISCVNILIENKTIHR